MDEELKHEAEASALQNERLQLLTASPQWGMLRAFIEDQVEKRMRAIMTTSVGTPEEMMRENFTKGECAFGKMLIEWIETQLAVTKDTVELYKQVMAERGE